MCILIDGNLKHHSDRQSPEEVCCGIKKLYTTEELAKKLKFKTMKIAMKRKERISQLKIEDTTMKLRNQKYITHKLSKENNMVLHERKKNSIIIENYALKIKIANNNASQKLNAAKEHTSCIEKYFETNHKGNNYHNRQY